MINDSATTTAMADLSTAHSYNLRVSIVTHPYRSPLAPSLIQSQKYSYTNFTCFVLETWVLLLYSVYGGPTTKKSKNTEAK